MGTSGCEKSSVSSDEVPSIKCCICARKDLVRDAEKYCVECECYLCLSCKDTHAQFPLLMGHQLLDKSNFGSLVSGKDLPFIPTERCSQHPRKILDLYCQDHDEVACASCIALSHRPCANVFSIPEDIDGLYSKEQSQEVKQKLDMSKTKMKEIQKITEIRIKELKKSLYETVERVKSFRQEIDKLLDNIEQKTVQKLQAMFETTEKLFKEKLHEAENMIQYISEVILKLRNSRGNDAQEFVCTKISARAISNADGIDRQHQQENVDERIMFTADNNIVSFLQPFVRLGEVTTVSIESKRTEQKTAQYTVKKEIEINVKLPEDTDVCHIIGSCLTEDGRLLLTDYYNKKLKRVDTATETIKDWLDLSACPYAVCAISRAEVAVTRNNNTVQFISLGNKLITARTLQMNHSCFGIACTQDKLFISDCSTNVYMYNTSGQQLQQISPMNVFSKARHLAVSSAGDRVFVVDCNNGLIILDSAGNHLSTVTDPTVSGYEGVCTDGRNIYACGYSSNNIVQIGQDHKLLGEVAKVIQPLSLCFDRQRNRIIVSKSNDNKITILKLM